MDKYVAEGCSCNISLKTIIAKSPKLDESGLLVCNN